MARILGFGGYVPAKVMTNDDWAALVDTSDEWITARTGIKERRFAADDESTLDLAANAAELAMEDAGLTAADIGEIIVATDTPEVYTPDTASFLQHRLGCSTVPAYDDHCAPAGHRGGPAAIRRHNHREVGRVPVG